MVGINFWYPKISKKQKKEIVLDALDKAKLIDEVRDKLGQNALTLSTGQRQRLALARALALRPKVLICDEPTSHLDVLSCARIEDFFEAARRHITILIVTHSNAQAARISQRTAYLTGDGSPPEIDDTDKIFTSPENESTQDFISGRIG